jgi:hypothetical protein
MQTTLNLKNKEKAEALKEILDQEDNNLPCLVCHL